MIRPVSMSNVNFGKMMEIKEVEINGKKTEDQNEISLAAEGLEDILLKRANPEKAESIRQRMEEKAEGDYKTPDKPVGREDNEKDPVLQACVTRGNKYLAVGKKDTETLRKSIDYYWNGEQRFTENGAYGINPGGRSLDTDENLLEDFTDNEIEALARKSSLKDNLGLKISATASPDKLDRNEEPVILVKDIDFIA